MSRRACMGILLVAVALAAGYFFWPSSRESPTTSPQATPQSKPQLSTTDPKSFWVIVNKQRGIPTTFEPALTVPEVQLRLAATHEQMQIARSIVPYVEQLFEAARKNNVQLVLGSGYRSAKLQKQFYDSYVKRDGKAAADHYSARPGYSEHQTGFALDIVSPNEICTLETCWKDTREGKWVAAHAHEHGFILRYPKGKQAITGYQYEPWHLRYVGKELATQLHQTKQTMEEFFNTGPAATY